MFIFNKLYKICLILKWFISVNPFNLTLNYKPAFFLFTTFIVKWHKRKQWIIIYTLKSSDFSIFTAESQMDRLPSSGSQCCPSGVRHAMGCLCSGLRAARLTNATWHQSQQANTINEILCPVIHCLPLDLLLSWLNGEGLILLLSAV